MKLWLTKAVTLPVRAYQFFISPWLGPCCRFRPSCSQYALEAVQAHGVLKGVWLAILRVMRCHPLHSGGFDPVPPARNKGDGNPC